MQKTNLVLTITLGLLEKIVRIRRYREISFVSFPLSCGKLCSYYSKRVPKEKRHHRGCLTQAHYFLPYLLMRHRLQRHQGDYHLPQCYHQFG
jgi:hypothetical protein